MKEKIKKILAFLNQWKIILAIILIGASLFYWFEWKPSQIRVKCQRQALELGIKSKLAGGLGEYDFFYRSCLRGNGLEKNQ